jgi:hypothetical protein
MRRKIGMLVLVFVAMIVIAVLVSLLFPATPAPPVKPLPIPNGYDSFVQAAGMLPGRVSDFTTMTPQELRTLVAANSNALQLARIGLAQESRVPLQYSQPFMSVHLDDLLGIKRLAQALAAEGRLAQIENRPADAAKSYLDDVRLGTASAQGGVLIDALVGFAMESIGTTLLEQLSTQLDAKSCREIVGTLETLDARRESWKDIVAQEHDWSHRTFPGFTHRVARLMTSSSTRQAEEKGRQKFNERVRKTRRLMVDLASHAYELDHQQKPTSVADLVPAYLKTIPQDPLTGTNMTLRP